MRLRSLPWLGAAAALAGCAAPPLPALGPDDPASPLAREATLAPAATALAADGEPTAPAAGPDADGAGAHGAHHGHP